MRTKRSSLGHPNQNPTNGSIVETRICLRGMFMWHSSKNEIQDWVEQKEREFSDQENRSPCMSSKNWLQKYIFKDQYENFLSSFYVELYEWISMLTERNDCFKGDEPKESNPKLIQRLKDINNRISRALDF